MRVSTKSLASLLLVTAVMAAVPGIGRKAGNIHRRQSRFDRMLQHHDRKGELRARVLGISNVEFKIAQKSQPFDEIIRKAGFKNNQAFRLALMGKIKDELRHRGWTAHRIERHVVDRSERVG